MSLSYMGVQFEVGDRLLLSFENREWIVFEIPSTWGGHGIPLDDSGFSIIGEILFPDSVRVLGARETGFDIGGLTDIELDDIQRGAELVIGRSDGTLVRFTVNENEDDYYLTSLVNDIEFNLRSNQSEWRLYGAL